MKHAFLLLGTLASFVAACTDRPASAPEPASVTGGVWQYDAVADDGGNELLVMASFPRGTMPDLGVLPGAEPFVRNVEVASGASWRSVTIAKNGGYRVPECAAAGCTLRYRFFLRDAARAFEDLERAKTFDGMTLVRPAFWMLHPAFARIGTRMRLHVATPPGTTFATGLYPAEDGLPDTYEADAFVLPAAPYTVFGRFDVRRAPFSGTSILVASEKDSLPVSAAAVDRWIAGSANSIAGYFGCFPVPRVLLVLAPTDGEDVVRGHALGDGGAVVVVEIGRHTADYQLHSDWVLPHELVHLAFPSLDPKHHWLEEGVATYVQPIARARSGAIDPQRAWSDLARGLPFGVAHPGDRGLDDAAAWGRTYWGGALFFLLADLEIRERTGDRYSLEDALRGIAAAGGNIATEWTFERVLDAGDRAVGVPVLRELYERMGAHGATEPVEPLLERLGIVPDGKSVRFDDDAPMAALRKSITAREPPRKTALTTCPAPAPAAPRYVQRAR